MCFCGYVNILIPGLGIILLAPISPVDVILGLSELLLAPLGVGIILGLLDGILMMDAATSTMQSVGPLEVLVWAQQ